MSSAKCCTFNLGLNVLTVLKHLINIYCVCLSSLLLYLLMSGSEHGNALRLWWKQCYEMHLRKITQNIRYQSAFMLLKKRHGIVVHITMGMHFFDNMVCAFSNYTMLRALKKYYTWKRWNVFFVIKRTIVCNQTYPTAETCIIFVSLLVCLCVSLPVCRSLCVLHYGKWTIRFSIHLQIGPTWYKV